jgi:hypothetical protein
MRRRLGLLSSLIALGLILALPATTLGATYTYSIQHNTCRTSGGDHGFGHLYFEVKMTEWGNTAANKFTFSAKAQHKAIGGSRWYTDWNAGTYTRYFRANSATNWYTRWWSYHPNDFAWHRFKVVLKVWHSGILLASKTLYGKTC